MDVLNDLEKRNIQRVEKYMDAAIVSINEKFGKGYSYEHPELVSGFMQTIVLEDISTFLSQINSDLEKIESRIQ